MQLNQESFEAWLFSQPRDKTWQYCCGESCLIATFIHETTSLKQALVGGTWYLPRIGLMDNEAIPLPSWIYNLNLALSETTYGAVQDTYLKQNPNFAPASVVATDADTAIVCKGNADAPCINSESNLQTQIK